MPVHDKKKQAIYARAHYLRNKAKITARAAIFTKEVNRSNKKFVARVKRRFGCSQCRMKNPLCLDFHHLRDKTANVANAVSRGWARERLKEEIRKCQILCANCHRIETLS